MLYGNVTNPWCQANAEFYCPWKFSKVQPSAMECFIMVYLCKKFKTKTILQNEEINFVWYNLLKFFFWRHVLFFCQKSSIKQFQNGNALWRNNDKNIPWLYTKSWNTFEDLGEKNEVKMLFSFFFGAKNGNQGVNRPNGRFAKNSLNLTQGSIHDKFFFNLRSYIY